MPTLRARSVPELFDAAFALTREAYAPLVTIAALAAIPRLPLYMFAPSTRPSVGEVLLRSAYGIGWGMVGSGAMLFAADARYHGREPSVSAAVGVAARRFVALFVGGLCTYLMIICGLLLFVVPGLILFVRYFAFIQGVVIEGLGVRGAIRRSRALSRGHGWRILAVIILPLLIYLPVIFGLQKLLEHAGMSVRGAQLVSELAGVLATPFFACVAILLYYDVRIRKEGYDLEVGLRETAPAPAPASPLASALPPRPAGD